MAVTTFSKSILVENKGVAEAHYGPWDSLSNYLDFIHNELLIDVPYVGTTIAIREGGKLVEYWNPQSAESFVKKQSEGGGDSADLSNYYTKGETDTTFLAKSGLKTVNGNSLVGTGNITIEGGSGDPTPIDYKIATYNLSNSTGVALKTWRNEYKFRSGVKYKLTSASIATGKTVMIWLMNTTTDPNSTSDKMQLTSLTSSKLTFTFTPTSDYNYIYFYVGGNIDSTDVVLYANDTASNLLGGIMSIESEEDRILLAGTANTASGVVNLKRKFGTPWKIAVLGDSITSTQVSGIGSIVSRYLGCQLVGNFAVGSATLTNTDAFYRSVTVASNKTAEYNTIENQVIRLLQHTTQLGSQLSWNYKGSRYAVDTSVCVGLGHTEDIPDIIYIAAGINDYMEMTGGEGSNESVMQQAYSELDRKTFASAIRWVCETLHCAYPKAQIFIATPLFTGQASGATQYTRSGVLAKRGAIINACVSNSVYVIDSTLKSGYSDFVASSGNGLHPGDPDKYRIAKFIAKEIYNNYIPEVTTEDKIIV